MNEDERGKRTGPGGGQPPRQIPDLFDITSDGIWIHDLKGEILEVNPAYCRMSGYSRDELIGMPISRLEAVETPEEIEAHVRKVLASGGHDHFESRHRRRDGSLFDVDIAAVELNKADGRMAIIVRDISARKKAVAGLRESRSRYLALVESTTDFIWEMDARGRYTYCSPQMEKLWGLKPEAMIGRTPFDVMPEEERAAAVAAFAELARSPRPFGGLESAALDAGGQTVFIETNGVPFFDEQGRLLGFRGISRDITHRKQFEKALAAAGEKTEAARKRLEEVLEAIPLALVLVEASTGRITYLNRAAQELYGVDYLGYDLADHLEKVRALRTDGAPFPLEEMPVGRSLKTGEAVHDVEMVIERADGRRIPVSVSSAPLLDAQGKIQTAIVAFSDIAARKDAEEQLERSNRRIKHILASIQDDFYVLDRDWRFVYASRNFTGRIGKEPKDFVGNVIWEMFPKHLGTPYEENVRAAMERGEVRRFEIEGKYTNSRYMITVFPSAEGITVLGTDITEQKKTEDAARENAERLRFALETSRTGAWELDLVDHTAFRSLDHDRIFGYQELRPQWTYEIFLDHVVPEDREEVNAKFREAIATKGLWNFECRIRRADGEIRWIWAAGRHRLGAAGEARRMVGIVQDITERKLTEVLKQALSEQESLRLGAALEQSPDAVVLFDLDGTIRYVNAAFGSINRVAKDEAKGRSYFETYAASAAASVRKAVSEGRTWQGQLSRRISAGQTVELEVAASAITDPKGGIVGGLATEKDITNELALQRQLRQSQKMEALGTLAGGIAHDFNNILNPIFISMELALLEPSLDLSIRQHLEVALKAAERGRDLVKQVIAFSRQKERERKPTKAGPVVQEAVNFLRASLPSTIEVKADIRDETGCVMGDPAQIHQIVMNLSGNAAYAMRQKGGVLTVGLDSVEVVKAGQAARMQGLKPGTYLRLTVSDTGTGMTPEVRDHLFDPFFTTKGPGEGSGMGLPVVDGIVRDYGGAIAVDTDEGRGSTFTVYVPRIESQESPRPVPLNSLPRGSGRILLIDDEEAQVYSVRGMLEKLGYKVTAMTKPQEALDLFRADREAFDLVITDQTMPRLTGLQVAEQVLKDRPGTPIVLCTGFSEAVDAKEAHALGIREFLMKPYSVREMAEVVRRTLAADLKG